MKKNELSLIDFSDGIKDREIQDNFELLQTQIERERVNVGGPGIASGLDITINVDSNNFNISLSQASIIAEDGSEVFIPSSKIEIERPKLSKEVEYLTADYNNQVILKHIPYSLDRRVPSQSCDSYVPNKIGIDIKYENSLNQDDYIRVRDIVGKSIILSGVTKRNVVVNYNYTAKRLDTLYIDKDYNVKVLSGVTSTTPSIVIPEDYKYLIAILEIDGLYTDKNNKTYANIILRRDLRKVRNLYTSKDGILYICGVPFDDLQIIHMTEPKDPKEYTMWYDSYTNQLKTWKACDSLVYMNEYINTTDFISNPDIRKDYKTDVYFYSGKNNISVYVNDVELDKRQFAEIHNNMPVDILDIEKQIMINEFRLYVDINIGDKITYKVSNFDGHYMWVPVNHSSYVNAKEIKLFGPSEEYENDNYFAQEKTLYMGSDNNNYPYKYQYFFFDREQDLNMLFTPGKKELELLINQTPLHVDQFEEITINDLYDSKLPNTVLESVKKHFGWNDEAIMKYNGNFDNIGLGFKLKEPLDVALGHEVNGSVDLYVEAIVQRRVNDGPLKRKLQRTATFVYEGTAVINQDQAINKTIDLDDSYYRYQENQLEVYLNGTKLIKDLGYEEGTDLSDAPLAEGDNGEILEPSIKKKSAITKQFKIKDSVSMAEGDIVSYRITTNIYSYDHINELLSELEYDAKTAIKKVDSLYDKTLAIQEDMEASLIDIRQELEEIQGIADNLDGRYLTKKDVIDISQMPANIVSNMVYSLEHIACEVTYIAGTLNYDVKEYIRQEDFVVAIRRDNLNNYDKMLIRGVDYTLYNLEDNVSNVYESTIFSLSSNVAQLMNNGDSIIFTGIKFGKAGR